MESSLARFKYSGPSATSPSNADARAGNTSRLDDPSAAASRRDEVAASTTAAMLVVSKPADIPLRDGAAPYVANFVFRGMRGRWRERFTAICSSCMEANVLCCHLPELPLRCLLHGHNPSEHAFQSGYFYSNPTNRMWLLLTGTLGPDTSLHYEGIAPAGAAIEHQNRLALEHGVGLSDLGVEPGNDAASYSNAVLLSWRADMYRAMAGHVRRVGDTLAALWRIAGGSDASASSSSAPAAAGSFGVGLKRSRGVDASSSARSAGSPAKRQAATSLNCEFAAGSATTAGAASGATPYPSALEDMGPDMARSILRVFADLARWRPGSEASAAAGAAASSVSLPSSSSASSSATPAEAAVKVGAGTEGGAAASWTVLLPFASEAACRDPRVCAPRVVAFTGKGQWKALFEPPLKTCEHGLQPPGVRPPGWPLPAATEVFVLSSSSGRAAMTDEQRRRPYRELAALVRGMPWLSSKQQATLAAAVPGWWAEGSASGGSSSSASSSSTEAGGAGKK